MTREPGPMPSLKLREIKRSGWPGLDYAWDDDTLKSPRREALMKIEAEKNERRKEKRRG